MARESRFDWEDLTEDEQLLLLAMGDDQRMAGQAQDLLIASQERAFDLDLSHEDYIDWSARLEPAAQRREFARVMDRAIARGRGFSAQD